jgi:hypothetical protein
MSSELRCNLADPPLEAVSLGTATGDTRLQQPIHCLRRIEAFSRERRLVVPPCGPVDVELGDDDAVGSVEHDMNSAYGMAKRMAESDRQVLG